MFDINEALLNTVETFRPILCNLIIRLCHTNDFKITSRDDVFVSICNPVIKRSLESINENVVSQVCYSLTIPRRSFYQ